MYRDVWKACHKAICAINFFSKDGINIITLTGFKVGNYLVTDEFAHRILNAKDVTLRFVDADGITDYASKSLPFWEFQDRIVNGNDVNKQGFAVINLESLGFDHLPSLKLSKNKILEIGLPTAVIGFHIDQENLALKTGIVSSYFKDDNGKRYIQFESSIKQGNSGAPLINIETMEVVGVVGHRLAGITRSYNSLMKIINKNLKTLEEVQGVFNIQSLDPIQVLIVNQNQMKHMTKEFYKLQSVRYGFAIEIRDVIECIEAYQLSSVNAN
jgi:V8-like Glu-specific endopeptidase